MIDLERLVYGTGIRVPDGGEVPHKNDGDFDGNEEDWTNKVSVYTDSFPLRPREAAGFYRKKGILDSI